jgi:hypothetical protein
MADHCYAECHYAECHYAECHYAECHVLFFIMLNVILMSVVMLSVVAPKGKLLQNLLSFSLFLCNWVLNEADTLESSSKLIYSMFHTALYIQRH